MLLILKLVLKFKLIVRNAQGIKMNAKWPTAICSNMNYSETIFCNLWMALAVGFSWKWEIPPDFISSLKNISYRNAAKLCMKLFTLLFIRSWIFHKMLSSIKAAGKYSTWLEQEIFKPICLASFLQCVRKFQGKIHKMWNFESFTAYFMK